MFKELMYKWFGLEDKSCEMCDYLKIQIEKLQIQNAVLVDKLTNKEVVNEPVVAPVPPSMMPHSVPWRVKRQMLEADDRKAAALKQQAERAMHRPEIGPNTIDGIEQEVLGNASEIR